MLRITNRVEAEKTILQLEGELTGVWVCELLDAWRNALRHPHDHSLCIDLSAVRRADKAGEYLLALIRSNGTQLAGSGLIASDLIQGIAHDWPAIANQEA